MFNKQVIEYVLRTNKGHVETTIDQLLQISTTDTNTLNGGSTFFSDSPPMRRPPSPPTRREETHFPHSGAHDNREKKKLYHTVNKYSPKRENTPNREFNDFTPPPPLPRSPPSYYPSHQSSYSPQQSSRGSFNHSSHNNYMHKASPQHSYNQSSSKDFYPTEKINPVKKSYPSTSAGHNFQYGAGERAGSFQYGAEKSHGFQYGEKAPSYKSPSHRDFDLNNGYNSRPKTSPVQKFQGESFDYNSRYGIEKKSPFRENYQNPPKSKYRDWNPPMLGSLPEDFLRVRESSPDHHGNQSSFTESRERSGSGSATRGSLGDLDDAKIAQLLSCREFLQELKMNKTFMAEMKKMMKADKKNKVCFFFVLVNLNVFL